MITNFPLHQEEVSPSNPANWGTIIFNELKTLLQEGDEKVVKLAKISIKTYFNPKRYSGADAEEILRALLDFEQTYKAIITKDLQDTIDTIRVTMEKIISEATMEANCEKTIQDVTNVLQFPPPKQLNYHPPQTDTINRAQL